MSRAISCPHCQRKLTVRDELAESRLSCPECKGQFQLPADEPAESGGNSDLGFLKVLSASPGGTNGKAGAKPSPGPGGSQWQALQKAAASERALSAQTLGRPSVARGKGIPLLAWYIGGGVTAVIVLVIILFVSQDNRKPSGAHGRASNVKYGLSERQRQEVFEALMTAVDMHGEDAAKRTRWPSIAADNKIDVDTLERILDEGFSSNWMQPAFSNYNIQAKTNRVEWIKKRNERSGNLPPRRR